MTNQPRVLGDPRHSDQTAIVAAVTNPFHVIDIVPMSYFASVADFHRPIASVVFLREKGRRVSECKCLQNAATFHPPDDPLELRSTAEDK